MSAWPDGVPRQHHPPDRRDPGAGRGVRPGPLTRPVPVKGLDAPLDAYELIGAGAIRSRMQAAAARGLTRFVGRQAEMDASTRPRTGARGRGQVVGMVGEPGVGKSRLVWEVTHSHRVEGWAILESGSVSYGKATSYLPVIDLLKAYCRIEAQDDARAIREKVIGKLLNLDESLRPLLPALLSLLDALPPAEFDPSATPGLPLSLARERGAGGEGTFAAWDALDPAQRRRQTHDAVKRLLLRESQEQPLLLVFEDLHWIDAETQAVLDSLLDSLPTARVLLLVNFRPEYTHTWGNRGYYTQLRIDPLGQESAEELLTALLGDDPSVRALYPLLIGRTDGNPFFLEESVRTLVEQRSLIGERGAYRLVHDLAALRVPPTVQAILAARIDRLPPEQKRLLQTSSVVGKDVPLPLLAADRRAFGRRSPARSRSTPGRRAPLRGQPVPRAGVHVQARADPRGRVRQPARRAPPRPARPHRHGHRAPPRGPSRRADRAPGAPRPARRALGAGGGVLPGGRAQGVRPVRVRRRDRALRAGAPGARAPARDPRASGASLRASAWPARRPRCPRHL